MADARAERHLLARIPDRALDRGSAADDITAVQLALNHLGFFATASGTFDADLADTLSLFQLEAGLEDDGAADRRTLVALRDALAQHIDEVAARPEQALPVVFADETPVCEVVDPKALIRTAPPDLSPGTGLLARGSEVEVLDEYLQGNRGYLEVRPIGAKGDPVWTSAGNLACVLERDDTLRADPPVPSDDLSRAERVVAAIHNEKGGYLWRKAAELDVPASIAVAVLATEAGGQGFGTHRPLVRFENHVFHNHWGKAHADRFGQHFRFNREGGSWKGHRFCERPGGAWEEFHGSQARENHVLDFACALDRSAGLYSISIGIAQIMGFNYQLLGYNDVQVMYQEFSASIEAQLDGFFSFVRNVRGCLQALRDRDYTGFARRYNGSGQAEHYGGVIRGNVDVYEGLLRRHGITEVRQASGGGATKSPPRATAAASAAPEPSPPAPAAGSAAPEPPPPAPAADSAAPEPSPPAAAEEGSASLGIVLAALPFLDDPADGVFGPRTELATRAFQLREGLAADGVAGRKTYAAAGVATDGPVLRAGARGDAVTRWQTHLRDTRVGGGGEPSPAEVKAFQTLQGLAADGVVGRRTLAAARALG